MPPSLGGVLNLGQKAHFRRNAPQSHRKAPE